MSKATVAPPSPAAIPSPAAAPLPVPRLSPEFLAAENRRHDRVLAALVVLVAFILASFPVVNSDVWMRLRTGQLIVNGEFTFWEDPFCYTSAGAVWVHTSWLFDVLVYAIYRVAEGAGLVLFRGLLVVVLTTLLLLIRRPGSSLFVSAFCICLAMVVVSQRLFLRSEMISFLFLGMTLYLLVRPGLRSPPAALRRLVGLTQNRLWIFLPPLFALWANLDDRFFLGPLTVLLFLAGEALQSFFRPDREEEDALTAAERRNLLVVSLVGIAACLLNPFTVFVFQIPGEWSSETYRAFQDQFRLIASASPFGKRYFQRGGLEQFAFRPLGLSIAEWSYYPLVFVGLVSFGMTWRQWRLWRVLVWLSFFGLSAWQVRNTALFAVVAGPVTALNLQDWALARFGEEPSVRRGWVALGQSGRVLLLVAVLILAALMIIPNQTPVRGGGPDQRLGIIHNRGGLGWSMAQDESLELASRQLAQWHREQKLPGHAFNYQWQDQPDYWAWFAPESKSFIDQRLKLHSRATAKAFVDTHEALGNTGKPDAQPYRWQQVFREHGVSHLVVSTDSKVWFPDPSDPSGKRRFGFPLVDFLLEDAEHWVQLNYCDGRNFVLAWRGSPLWKPGQLEELRFDTRREAFQQPRGVPETRESPTLGRSPWLALLTGEAGREPTGYAEAEWYHRRHQFEQMRDGQYRPPFLAAMVALTRTPLVSMYMPLVQPAYGANLHLAVRAIRRSVAENPFHAESYQRMFEIYRSLYALEQIEGRFPNPLREAQMLAALRRAAYLMPEEPLVHQHLAIFYLEKEYLDLALKHYAFYREARSRRGGEINPSQEALDKALEEDMKRADGRWRGTVVRYQSNIRPTMQDGISRARWALKNDRLSQANPAFRREDGRLTREAIAEYMAAVEQLMAHSPGQGAVGFLELAELLMDIGYLGESHPYDPPVVLRWQDSRLLVGFGYFSRDLYSELIKAGVPDPYLARYHKLTAQAAAAYGDYDAAIAHLSQVAEFRKVASVRQMLRAADLQARGGSPEQPSSYEAAGLGYQAVYESKDRAAQFYYMGLMALEAGWTQRGSGSGVDRGPRGPSAAELFRTALADIDSLAPFKLPAGYYYYQITGEGITTTAEKDPSKDGPSKGKQEQGGQPR